MSTNIIINDTFTKVQYIATASQTIFAYSFPIYSENDLAVYRTPVGQTPDDTAQRLTINSDYTIAGVGAEDGGSITLSINVAAGDRITLEREMPLARLSSYAAGKTFNSANLDIDFNAAVMMLQQLYTLLIKRVPHYENTIKDDTKELRLPVLPEGYFWKRNSAGIVAALLEENPDWSTLRSELADANPGTDGARLIGFESTTLGSTTVHDALSKIDDHYGIDTGVADALIVNFTSPYLAYSEGMLIYVKVADYNSDEATINVDGLGAKSIKLQNGQELYMGNLIPNMIAQLFYNGAHFILMNPEEPIVIGFKAKLNSNIVIPVNTETKIIFPATDFNYDSGYDIASGTFTASIKGLYLFTLSGQYTSLQVSVSLALMLRLKKNSALIAESSMLYDSQTHGTTSGTVPPISVLVELNAGDIIEAYSYQAFNPGSLMASNETYLTGTLISRLP